MAGVQKPTIDNIKRLNATNSFFANMALLLSGDEIFRFSSKNKNIKKTHA
jgi:hypothetical protein